MSLVCKSKIIILYTYFKDVASYLCVANKTEPYNLYRCSNNYVHCTSLYAYSITTYCVFTQQVIVKIIANSTRSSYLCIDFYVAISGK